MTPASIARPPIASIIAERPPRPNKSLPMLILLNSCIPSNAPILSPNANAPKIPDRPRPSAIPPIAIPLDAFAKPRPNIANHHQLQIILYLFQHQTYLQGLKMELIHQV